MSRYIILSVWLVSFLFNSSIIYADGSKVVSDWTQETLLSTLAASYRDTPDDIAEVQQYFFPSAWYPMIGFLKDKRVLINAEKLTLHPYALTPPQIIKSGYCGTVRCWRIKQTIGIPELQLKLDVSLLVVPSTGNTPFLIQSLDMSLHKY